MLAILSVLFLALTVFLALKAFRAQPADEKPADQQLPDSLRDTKQLPPVKPPGDATDSKRTDYMFGWLATLAAFLAVGGVAMWMLAAPPAGDEARQKTEARIAILALGASFGALAILFGMIFFYQWRESLTNWLDKGQTKDAKWVLTPILMIVAGAGLIFFAIQPARADERNNGPIRRVVYWSNFGLTVLLLLVAFVVANVLFSLKVPNKLDTTATGFYSLSDNTKNLFARLERADHGLRHRRRGAGTTVERHPAVAARLPGHFRRQVPGEVHQRGAPTRRELDQSRSEVSATRARAEPAKPVRRRR